MMHALAVSPSAILGLPWSPGALGAALLGWWDAERSDLITQAGGSVSSWQDIVAGYNAAQATGSTKPAYSATSFNNRAGITFDGVDDYLELASQPFPSGAAPSELWLLASQSALPADATTRVAISYGGDTSQTRRGIQRGVSAGVNTAVAVVGDGTSAQVVSNTVDFSGRIVARASVGGISAQMEVNGTASSLLTVTPATGSSRLRIGSISNATPSLYWQGAVAVAIVTSPLVSSQAAQLLAYLKARGGIS